ncbi:GGDEF domain-containing protein [Planomicrobium sp. CPCC 101079]|uniref:GGDEF domain-containing protein n=1 Tax=Planomicrobium sp. CPCC 101079 TaxID=2599618 RepID=UPI0011B7C3DF|nr:GGDEF domain-containing protein [Planomicrobium sp. CPCC 101079]TWT14588.1 GGDEF domain-containing protein [Planomicrobium sp. CPCC 101079]
MFTSIGEIYEEVPCVGPETKSREVDKIFKSLPNIQGIIVKTDESYFALVMKTSFYQVIGNQYGYNLYMGRPIDLIMNKSPLVLDHMRPILEVSQLAMERPIEELYDYIIVTKEDQCLGAVSIQSLLLAFAKIQKETALLMNPLTGLPGNNSIDHELAKILDVERFSVLYVDLDNFKTYNDTYGFKKGDDLLLATADVITRNVANNFFGHIGGDDFVAILHHHNYEEIAGNIINDFSRTIQGFYSDLDWAQQYVIAENRAGHIEKIPLVSISIAIVTNKEQSFVGIQHIVDEAATIKKLCKQQQFSCFITNSPKTLAK